MTTRRPVRPDGKHYRDSRRQRQARSRALRAGVGKRGLWMALAAIFMIGLLVTGTLIFGRHQTHLLESIAFYVCIVVVVFSIIAAVLTPK
jgi:purine-cytosine permease-like protein